MPMYVFLFCTESKEIDGKIGSNKRALRRRGGTIGGVIEGDLHFLGFDLLEKWLSSAPYQRVEVLVKAVKILFKVIFQFLQ